MHDFFILHLQEMLLQPMQYISLIELGKRDMTDLCVAFLHWKFFYALPVVNTLCYLHTKISETKEFLWIL